MRVAIHAAKAISNSGRSRCAELRFGVALELDAILGPTEDRDGKIKLPF
jgi:hypothetical protein